MTSPFFPNWYDIWWFPVSRFESNHLTSLSVHILQFVLFCKIFEFFSNIFWFVLHFLIFQSCFGQVRYFKIWQTSVSRWNSWNAGILTTLQDNDVTLFLHFFAEKLEGVPNRLSSHDSWTQLADEIWWNMWPQECTAKPLFRMLLKALDYLHCNLASQKISFKSRWLCFLSFDLSCCYTKSGVYVGAISLFKVI